MSAHESTSRTRHDSVAGLLALLGYALFYRGFFFQSFLTDELIAPSDALDFGVAAYLSPPSLWTDGLYSGYPIAADPQSLVFYPLLQLCRALGAPWNVFMMAAFVVASTTTFVLVRRLTGSNGAATFSGLAFGFSGPMLGNMGHFNQLHAMAWAPLLLYGLQLIREGRHRAGAATGACGYALMWLAGHPQIPLYMSYLALALMLGGLAVDRPDRRTTTARVLWSGIAVALGLGLAAIVLVPMAELSALASRTESNWELYTSKAVPPWQLLTLALPFSFGFWADDDRSIPYFGDGSAGENLAYMGLLPLALLVAAPLAVGTRRSEARLWAALALAAVLLAICDATPLGTIFYYAPGYARFRMPSRHLFLAALCTAVVAGIVLDDLARRGRSRTVATALAGLVIVALAAFALFAAQTPAVAALLRESALYLRWTIGWTVAVGLVGAVLVVSLGRVHSTRARTVLLGTLATLFLAFDLGAVHYRVPGAHLEYADVPPTDAQPKPPIILLREELQRTGERVLAADGTHNPFLLPNLTRPWMVPAAGASGPLGVWRYVELLRMGGPGDVPLETLNPPHVALDLFAIRYVLVPTETIARELEQQPARWAPAGTMQYDPEDPESHYTLFRNKHARPRAWCVGTVTRGPEETTLAALRTAMLADGSPFDPTRTVLAEPGELADWRANQEGSAERTVTASDGFRTFQVQSPTTCVLVVSEVFYPWWRASVDGVPVTPSRVNHTMVGVVVPAGTHTVRLSLQPLTVWSGAAISGASLLACLVLVVGAVGRR